MLLSAVIITYNEERNLKRCLESLVGIVDEVVIIDSNSSDGTCTIANTYNARVIQHPFKGFAEQKNIGVQNATHDWVLSLDADEALSESLKQAILKIKIEPKFDAYFFNRLTSFCGKFIKHGSWYPDRQCRMWNKNKGKWTGLVHETWRFYDTHNQYGYIKDNILHYSFYTVEDYFKMIERYTSLSAESYFNSNKKVSMLKLYLGPVVKFINDYFLKLGFLDGTKGFKAHYLAAYMSFVKYKKVRERFNQG